MKISVKYTAFAAALLMGCAVCGCAEKNIQENSADSPDSSAAEIADGAGGSASRAELTDEQKTNASEVGISEERYCIDDTPVKASALELLSQYYRGIEKADHNMCFDTFPDFYKAAIEKENSEYGDTNDEYMLSIRDKYAGEFGDDFEFSPSINSVLQISDESLERLETRISKAFDIEIKLDDLYYIYFSENVKGSLSSSEYPLEFTLLYTDGKYWLYDDYFETVSDEELSEAVTE